MKAHWKGRANDDNDDFNDNDDDDGDNVDLAMNDNDDCSKCVYNEDLDNHI